MSETLRIERAPGAITVKHHDAVIGSSRNALIVHGEREAPVFYLPKEDVYFEQMTEVGAGDLSDGRRANFWSVVGSGGGVESAAWLISDSVGTAAELSGHVGFDPGKLSIEGAG